MGKSDSFDTQTSRSRHSPLTLLAEALESEPDAGSPTRRLAASDFLHELLDSFEDAWQQPTPPRVDDFLQRAMSSGVLDGEPPSLARALLHELVALDLEYRWKHASATHLNNGPTLIHDAAEATQPRLEDYAALLDAHFGKPWPVKLIVDEYQIRHRVGDRPAPQEYLDRFAGMAELQAQLGSVDRPPGPSSGDSDAALTDPACASLDPFALAGKVIGDYELVREIARGGMGVVYEARQRSLNRTVALKMILAGHLSSNEAVRRFYTEARAAAGLHHPHIVPVFEVGQERRQHYFSMAYVDGRSLSARVAGEGPFSPREAAYLMLHVAEALDYAHRQGVVHRDLKPQNVLLSKDGQPLVTDFGLAKQIDDVEGLTVSGQLLGTPSFMSPEQAQGNGDQVGPVSDVYALGALLYYLLTGRPPFHTSSVVETLKQVIEREPLSPRRLNPEVNRDLETICLKCLQKEPPRRYGTAQQLAEDLQRFLRGEAIHARPIGRIERAWRWCRRNPSTAALCSISLVLLVAGPIVWQQRQLDAAQAREANSLRQAAIQRADALQQANEAAHQVALTQEYYATVNEARQVVSRGRPGWSAAAIDKLRHAAALETQVRNRAELRSEAAACLINYDVELQAELAKGMQAGQVAFSADGDWLAVGQRQSTVFVVPCTVLVLDAQRGDTIHRLSFPPSWVTREGDTAPDGCRQLAFRGDRRWLVAGARSGNIHAWDFDRSPPELVSWRGHGQEVSGLFFSPDGKRIYSASEKDKTIKAWDLTEGGAWQEAAQCSLEGKVFTTSLQVQTGRLVVEEGSHTLTLLDPGSLEVLNRQKLAYNASISAAFLENTVLLSGERRLELFDYGAKTILRTYNDAADPGRNLGEFRRAEFSGDCRLLMTVHGSDRRATVWDVSSGKVVCSRLFEPDVIAAASLSLDGRRLAMVADHRVLLFDVYPHLNRTLVSDRAYLPQAMAWGPRLPGQEPIGKSHYGSRFLACGDAALFVIYEAGESLAIHTQRHRLARDVNEDEVQVWDTSQPVVPPPVKLTIPKVSKLSFSPDGSRLWGISDELKVWSWSEGDNAARLHFGNQLANMLTGRSSLLSLAAGDRFVLIGTRFGELLSLVGPDSEPQPLRVSSQPIVSIALAPSQDMALCGAENGELVLVSAPKGEVLSKLTQHDDAVPSVAFSPDGRFIASSSLDRTVRLWRRRNRQAEELLTLKFPAAVPEICFHPDGRTLAIRVQGELAIRLLDLDQLEQELGKWNLGWGGVAASVQGD